VYFPRLIVPIAVVVVAVVDFFISFLVIMMAWYKFVRDWQILLLSFFVAVASLVSLAPGLWVTALNVKYLDFRFVTPFLVSSKLVSMSRPLGSVPMWYRTSGDSSIASILYRCHRWVPLVHP
jgi:hypothetical protein